MSNFEKDELIELKKLFAKHLIKNPTEPFKAACYIFKDNNDLGNRLIAACEWPNDPIVIFEIDSLVASNNTVQILPTKDEIAYEIYLIGKKAFEPEDKLKAYKLYAELQGMVKSPGININNSIKTINDNSRVLEVMEHTNHGSDDNWEDKLLLQQKKLTAQEVDFIPNAATINKPTK
jgi:hypothetical protein